MSRNRQFHITTDANQGRPADRLFLLTKGLVKYFFVTEEGKKLLFQWLGAGDLFGGRRMLLTHSFYLASTEAVMDSLVLVRDRMVIRGLIQRYLRLLGNGCSYV